MSKSTISTFELFQMFPEEAGNYGYGATEAEAVQDFIDNCQEDHDARLA